MKLYSTEPTFVCPTCGQEFYKTTDAANWLEMKVSAFKYHIHAAKNITPLVSIGRRLALFTRQQLDTFQDNRRKPGRPRKPICIYCGQPATHRWRGDGAWLCEFHWAAADEADRRQAEWEAQTGNPNFQNQEE